MWSKETRYRWTNGDWTMSIAKRLDMDAYYVLLEYEQEHSFSDYVIGFGATESQVTRAAKNFRDEYPLDTLENNVEMWKSLHE